MMSATRTLFPRSTQCLRMQVPVSPVSRRVIRYRNPVQRRFQSTHSNARAEPSVANATTSPLAAGIAGGLVTLVGGYIWYNVSGTKTVVQSARSVIETYEATKNKIASVATPPSPKQALNFIRDTTRNYSSFLPSGTSEKIDAVIKELEELSDDHKDEVERLVNDTYNELKEVLSKGGLNAETAKRVGDIIARRSKEVANLSGDIGSDIISKNPKLAKALQSAGDSDILNEMKDMANAYGPEAKKALEEGYGELRKLLKDGNVTDPTTIYRAGEVIRNTSQRIKDIGIQAGEKAWDEAQKSVYDSGYLEKLPKEVRDVLENNMDDLKRVALGGMSVSGVGGIYELWKKLRSYSNTDWNDPKNLQRFKSFVEGKVKEGKDMTGEIGQQGWERTMSMVEEYVRSIPGGEKIIEQTPPINELLDLAKQKSPEAKKLMEDTFSDISEVLNKRLQEAKRLANDTREEGRQKSEQKQKQKQ